MAMIITIDLPSAIENMSSASWLVLALSTLVVISNVSLLLVIWRLKIHTAALEKITDLNSRISVEHIHAGNLLLRGIDLMRDYCHSAENKENT